MTKDKETPTVKAGDVIGKIPRELVRKFLEMEANAQKSREKLRYEYSVCQAEQTLLWDEAHNFITDKTLREQSRRDELCIHIDKPSGNITVEHLKDDPHDHPLKSLLKNLKTGTVPFISYDDDGTPFVDLGLDDQA